MRLFSKIKQRIDFYLNHVKVWYPCNIYTSAIIGKKVSIGMFSEIGADVVVGANTRIGKGAFIPKGVFIGRNCFIGPHVTFTNDKYPPAPKSAWQKTYIADGVSIGAGATILCGITIHRGARIGAGAVVTKDVPEYQTWAGVPAEQLK